MTQLVISAAIIDPITRRILLAQRSGTSYAGLWSTPGGKTEGKESPFGTLDRELDEELRVRIDPMSFGDVPIYQQHVTSSRTSETYLVLCYRVPWHAIIGTPQCGDKTSAVRWFTIAQLRSAQLTPADNDNRVALIAAINRASGAPYALDSSPNEDELDGG